MGLLGETFGGIRLIGDKVMYGGDTWPVAGTTARVEQGADVAKRVTATRLLALGVFALAVKKQQGHVFLTLEGPELDIAVEVLAKKEGDARKFAAKVNAAGKRK
ncbi:MAG: hypothetical protein HHJ11_18815 [Phycicoccus sp.]|nr:hypothetical protein [Cellulomonas sp.]NMM25492.1 hypothetical protein [Phycicoccus sp.]